MALGPIVTNRTSQAARGLPSDISTVFVAAKPGTGSLVAPVVIKSMTDYVTAYGQRSDTGNAASYDWLDNFFHEGGKKAYMARYTSTNLATALGLFSPDLGPGAVVAPEETPGAVPYGALLDHGFNNNRFALLDVANGDSVAAMSTLGGLIPATHEDYGMAVGPWPVIPAPDGVIGGSARTVHGSSTLAALMTRADDLGNPNRAAAGPDFPLQYATGFAVNVPWASVETLLNAGINPLINLYQVPQLYGFQTGIAQTPDSPFWQANPARARMWLTAQAQVIGSKYVFKNIDGEGRLAGALKTQLEGACLKLYKMGGLYGKTPADAFSVNVDASVNTEAEIAQGYLNAVLEARWSLHAKAVKIGLVSIPVTGRVSTSQS